MLGLKLNYILVKGSPCLRPTASGQVHKEIRLSLGVILRYPAHILICVILTLDSFTIPPASTKLKGGIYWCHLVRLSVFGQNRVRSVSSTILIGSILYLHILSNNSRRCVACFKIQNLKFWRIFKICSFDFVFFFYLGSNMTQWCG